MIKGFIAGNFDVIHPGYIKTFKECKENCDHFTILLHTDPTIERPNKLKPILSVNERIEVIKNNKFNKRFLGDDYTNKDFTGSNLNIPVHYISRNHGWSTTQFKNLIVKSFEIKKG